MDRSGKSLRRTYGRIYARTYSSYSYVLSGLWRVRDLRHPLPLAWFSGNFFTSFQPRRTSTWNPSLLAPLCLALLALPFPPWLGSIGLDLDVGWSAGAGGDIKIKTLNIEHFHHSYHYMVLTIIRHSWPVNFRQAASTNLDSRAEQGHCKSKFISASKPPCSTSRQFYTRQENHVSNFDTSRSFIRWSMLRWLLEILIRWKRIPRSTLWCDR